MNHPEAKKFTNDLRELLRGRKDLVNPIYIISYPYKIHSLANKVPGFKANMPSAAFYLYTDVTEAMKMKNVATLEEFRKLCLKETGLWSPILRVTSRGVFLYT